MKLFKCEDGFNVVIEPEALQIESFHRLYLERNGNENLIQKEFAYIYFFNDTLSDFNYEGKEVERKEDIKKYINLPNNWEPDEYVIQCEKDYVDLSKTMTSELIKTMRNMIQKIKDELEAIDLGERDKNGKPVYDIKKIIETSKQIPNLISEVDKVEKEYIRNQKDQSKNRGAKSKSEYEDM